MALNGTLAVFPAQLLGADNSYTNSNGGYYKKLNLTSGNYYAPVTKRISVCDDEIHVQELVTTTYKEQKEKLGS